MCTQNQWISTTSKFKKVLSYHNSLITTTDCIPGPSKDEMQLLLMNDERASVGTKGATTLIGNGLKIEESQYVNTSSAPGAGRSYIYRAFLATLAHRLGRNASTKEKLDLAGRRQHLQSRLDEFHVCASQFWPVDDDDLWLEGGMVDPLDILPSDSDKEELPPQNQPVTH